MCDNCEEECGDGQECYSECGKMCNLYGNMEENGLVDATDYIECQEAELPEDDGERRRLLQQLRRARKKQQRKVEEGDEEEGEEEDMDEEEEDEEEEQQYFIGPKCSDSGKTIELSLFYDENCWQPIEEMGLGVFLDGELSYYFMQHTFRANDAVCLTCAEDDENANQNDEEDADEVNEMCENLYDASAKCETPNGITAGFMQTKMEDGEYENQVETEFLTCAFINSLVWNSYTETGEIDFLHDQDVYVRHLTQPQGIALGLISLWFLGLVALMRYFQKKIAAVKDKKVDVKADNRAIWA
uniref:Uncharacterized protein n=1 Tax=Entomoneis paludosa TaxID=265537 RepID=A0A7S3DPH3_9STRA